jgi:TPR repeat protein
MKQFLIAFLFSCAMSTPQAGNFEVGMRHLDAKAYASAAAAFRLAASDGNSAAERQLGFMYYRGIGFAQSDVQAAAWFERAGARGDLQSQINLGQMYENGLSVPQSNTRSAHWYSLAAEQGDRMAQFRFGEICYLGTGVAKDRAEAVKWWRIALRNDDDATVQMRSMIDAAIQNIPAETHAEGKQRADAWLSARSQLQ